MKAAWRAWGLRSLVPAAVAIGAFGASFAPSGCKGDAGDAPQDAAVDAVVTYETVADIPEADRRDVASSSVVWDAVRRRVLVATSDGGALVRVDPDATAREVFPLGFDVRSVALSPDGARVAIVDRGGQGENGAPGQFILLDAATLAVLWTQPLDGHPRTVVFDPAHPRYAYVTIEDEKRVAILDRATHTIAGSIATTRLPAGLAAAGARDELLITHRIDGAIDVIDRTQHTSLATITLADSPSNADPKVPQGKPYAFEGLAFTPDGKSAWVPHQTYSGAGPLQFQSIVFPAISVVDLEARAEKSNVGAGKKNFPGRKELFAAIDVKVGGGDAQIVSGPTAVAVHPNGQRAYALMGTSDDLVVFDALTGNAAEILSLPGDHPTGLALESSGGRAFVFTEQSKTLVTVDLAGGSPIGHPSLVGDPRLLLDRDPVAPELRRGLTLFHRGSRDDTFDDGGTKLALAGDSWMACASCHVDGFTGTNELLFEASPRKQPAAATDALIGHRGLRDFFSTAAAPDAPEFDPHDVVVALLDMGGLTPDRTGKDRTGAADPSKPSPAVLGIARDLARLVQRDMPHGPSWILQNKTDSSIPKETSIGADAAYCGSCHKEELETWKRSAHSHAGEDPFVGFAADAEAKAGGPSAIRHCQGCHDPNGVRLGNPSLKTGQGVTCTSCHDVSSLIEAGGNADLRSTPRDWAMPHAKDSNLPLLRSAEFCAGCHESFVPGDGLVFIDTLNEWKASPFGPHDGKAGKACVSCHMQPLPSGAHDHGVVGGNLALAARFPTPGWADSITANLKSAAALKARHSGDSVDVDVIAVGVGHMLPTGVPDVRELWIELVGLDAGGAEKARLFAPASDTGLIADDGPRLGMDLASSDGTVLRLHELNLATSIPFDRRVPSGQTVTLSMDAKTLYATPGVSSVVAELHYRNLRPPFYRAALADPSALPPDVVIAQSPVE